MAKTVTFLAPGGAAGSQNFATLVESRAARRIEMAKPRKRANWKKLELQKAEQIAEIGATLEKWATDGADLCLIVDSGFAAQLTIKGNLFVSGKDRADRPLFTFASSSREINSTIALGIYDSLELKEEAYQVVTLRRSVSQVALVRLPKGKEIDVFELPTPWGTN